MTTRAFRECSVRVETQHAASLLFAALIGSRNGEERVLQPLPFARTA